MSFAYGHIAQRLFDTPLMYDPRKAEAFLAGLGGRIAGSQIVLANGAGAVEHQAFENGRPTAGRIGDFVGRARASWNGVVLYAERGVAVIPIEGSLVHKGTFIGQSSGVTSYEGILAQIAVAARDESVKAVVFEIDSYGGETSGAFETAAAIAALSKIKPTIAILTDHAYSAGYLLASQAREIIAPEFGGAGSIGVITSDYGIDFPSVSPGLFKLRMEDPAYVEHCGPFRERCYDLAEALGAQIVVLFPPICDSYDLWYDWPARVTDDIA